MAQDRPSPRQIFNQSNQDLTPRTNGVDLPVYQQNSQRLDLDLWGGRDNENLLQSAFTSKDEAWTALAMATVALANGYDADRLLKRNFTDRNKVEVLETVLQRTLGQDKFQSLDFTPEEAQVRSQNSSEVSFADLFSSDELRRELDDFISETVRSGSLDQALKTSFAQKVPATAETEVPVESAAQPDEKTVVAAAEEKNEKAKAGSEPAETDEDDLDSESEPTETDIEESEGDETEEDGGDNSESVPDTPGRQAALSQPPVTAPVAQNQTTDNENEEEKETRAEELKRTRKSLQQITAETEQRIAQNNITAPPPPAIQFPSAQDATEADKITFPNYESNEFADNFSFEPTGTDNAVDFPSAPQPEPINYPLAGDNTGSNLGGDNFPAEETISSASTTGGPFLNGGPAEAVNQPPPSQQQDEEKPKRTVKKPQSSNPIQRELNNQVNKKLRGKLNEALGDKNPLNKIKPGTKPGAQAGNVAGKAANQAGQAAARTGGQAAANAASGTGAAGANAAAGGSVGGTTVTGGVGGVAAGGGTVAAGGGFTVTAPVIAAAAAIIIAIIIVILYFIVLIYLFRIKQSSEELANTVIAQNDCLNISVTTNKTSSPNPSEAGFNNDITYQVEISDNGRCADLNYVDIRAFKKYTCKEGAICPEEIDNTQEFRELIEEEIYAEIDDGDLTGRTISFTVETEIFPNSKYSDIALTQVVEIDTMQTKELTGELSREERVACKRVPDDWLDLSVLDWARFFFNFATRWDKIIEAGQLMLLPDCVGLENMNTSNSSSGNGQFQVGNWTATLPEVVTGQSEVEIQVAPTFYTTEMEVDYNASNCKVGKNPINLTKTSQCTASSRKEVNCYRGEWDCTSAIRRRGGCYWCDGCSCEFLSAVFLNGTGVLRDGTTVRYDGSYLLKEDVKENAYGSGARGAVIPFRTFGANLDVFPAGTVIYIPEYDGMELPNGKLHDGCFIMTDTGDAAKENGGKSAGSGAYRIDIYAYRKTYLSVVAGKTYGENSSTNAVVNAERCLNVNYFEPIGVISGDER